MHVGKHAYKNCIVKANYFSTDDKGNENPHNNTDMSLSGRPHRKIGRYV